MATSLGNRSDAGRTRASGRDVALIVALADTFCTVRRSTWTLSSPVAEMLATSVPAVKSTLQRARARLAEVSPSRDDVEEPTEQRTRELLDGYMAAWTAGDPEAFGRVLRADAAIELLPSRVWFAGKDRCLAFAAPSMAWSWQMTATSANGQPAAVAYLDGKPFGVAVLTAAPDGIAKVTVYTPVPAGGW